MAGSVGCFIGLATTDMIYRLGHRPGPDEKLEAEDVWMGAGGPAANAAATFALLGGTAHLVTAVGSSPWASVAVGDLVACGVRLHDRLVAGSLPVSSVLVAVPGERQVVTTNRRSIQVSTAPVPGLPEDVDVVVIDSHLPELVRAVPRPAGVPVVLDPGNPKASVAEVLSLATTVVGPAAWGRQAPVDEVLAEWQRLGPRECAITRGGDSIRGRDDDYFTVAVPAVAAIDTLGAGDVLHGALAFYLASGCTFRTALEKAAGVAASSCRYLGPRRGVAEAAQA